MKVAPILNALIIGIPKSSVQMLLFIFQGPPGTQGRQGVQGSKGDRVSNCIFYEGQQYNDLKSFSFYSEFEIFLKIKIQVL